MFCASLLIAVHCVSQTGEIKPITAKQLQTPNNVTFYFNVGDTTFWASMGQYGQMSFVSKKFIEDKYVPYKGAKKDVVLNKRTLKASSIVLLKDSVPQIVQEGQMYWDSITQSVVVNTEDPDVHLNVGEELWVPMCYNNSGSNILNGQPVYISGSSGGYPTVSIASNTTYTRSRLIGVATDDILNGQYGRVARFGYVNGVNLSACTAGDNVYLGDGVLTHVRPSGGNFPVVIGKAIVCHTNGKLLVYPQNAEYTAETNQAYGWPSYIQGEQTVLSFTNATRTFTITPVLTSFYFYQGGIKYIKNGSQSFQISDVEGIHLLYYDQGTIYDAINPSGDQALSIIRNNITISAIYWDATNKISIYTSNERHTFYWPSWVHAYAHLSFGTQYVYGLGLTNITLGAGTSNTDAQFGVDAGAIADEDVTSSQDIIASTAGLPIYSRTGSNGLWRRTTRSGYSFLNDGTTGLAQYNLYSGGTWSIVSMTNNYYRLVHVFATNDIGLNKTIVMSGVAQYASAAAAEAAVSTEIANIYNSNLPFAEVKHIGSLILHTKTGLGNSVNARYVATTTGGSWIDYRRSNVIPTASSGGSGVSTFLSLSDTPVSYSGQANKLIGVGSSGKGVEFKDITKNSSGLNIPSGQTYNINNNSIIVDSINDAVTTTAPSQNAVYDALSLKENLLNKENTTVDNSTTKYPTVNLLKTYADTKDPSISNEGSLTVTDKTSYSKNIHSNTTGSIDIVVKVDSIIPALQISRLNNKITICADTTFLIKKSTVAAMYQPKINNSQQHLSGTNVTWNLANGKDADITLTGNTVITITNATQGLSGTLWVTNASSTYTITFAGYINSIDPFIRLNSNMVITSGGGKSDDYTYKYNGTKLNWNGTLNRN